MNSKTIIIGGGMAGISAALRLKEHNKDFIMITDTLGGRVKYVKEKKVNLGAYFVINNYTNVKKILKKEKWLNTGDAQFIEDETESFQTLSLKTLSLVPQILKFAVILLRFGFHYKKFKKKCETLTHIEALKTDKYLTKLSNQSSSDFISQNKLQKLADAIIYKFAYGCTLTPAEFQSAFDMLTPGQGIIIPMYKFSFDEEGMADRLKKELVIDKVTGIEKKNNVYEVKTEKGKTFTSENLIMAASSGVAKQLLGLPQIRKNSCAYAFHIKGEPLERYSKHGMNTFSSKYEISSITKEFNNTYLVYSTKRDTDFKKYFKKWEVIGKAEWDPAIYVYDNYLLEQNFNENITIAGDHNSCGMEPAAIAGIYAANRVLEKVYGVKIKKEKNIKKKIFLGLVVAALVFIFTYLPVISPYLCSRGTVGGEMTMSLPGDDLLPENPKINMTHAVTVNATPDKVWPWMVQIGQDRGGFYSFEKLERLFGFGIHNTYRIVPEWQEMKPGDFIKFHKNGIGMLVNSVDKGKSFVLLTDSRKPMTPVPGQRVEFLLPLPKDMYMAWNWSFNLIPLPDGKTRIVIRSLADFNSSNIIVNWLFHFGSEITGCVMNWQLTNELKQCAEGEQDNIKIHL